VFYRRIWNIVGKYSILCCDKGVQLPNFETEPDLEHNHEAIH
jgi:hypothetical protein